MYFTRDRFLKLGSAFLPETPCMTRLSKKNHKLVTLSRYIRYTGCIKKKVIEL